MVTKSFFEGFCEITKYVLKLDYVTLFRDLSRQFNPENAYVKKSKFWWIFPASSKD
jgi:hypothetical protein